MSAIGYGAIAGLQLASGYFSSQNIKATAQLNQDIAEMNAQFAELDAFDAKVDGLSEAARYQTVIDQTLSEQQARLTAADVDINYGSAAAIQNETRFVSELNKMELLKQAEESALGYKTQARQYRTEGALGYARGIQEASTTMFNSAVGAASSAIDSRNAYLSGYR